MVGIKQDFDEVKMEQIEDIAESINNVIKPFVVERQYDIFGDFYMSSATDVDKFKIGDRVFFSNKYGIGGIFGTVMKVEKIDHNDTRLFVNVGDGVPLQIYEILGSQVTNLEE